MKIYQQPETYITQFRQQHLEQVVDLLTRSFLQLNKIWKNHQHQSEEVYPILRGKIIPALSSGWSYVLMKKKNIIGVFIEYELLDYLRMPSMPSSLKLFKILGEAGTQLQSKVDFSQAKRGESIYGLYGAIDPSEAKRGLSLQFWWYGLAIGKLGGWKYFYSRISSPISLKIIKKLGAQILAEVDCQNEKLWMIRIDLTKPLPPLKLLKKPKQAIKKQNSAKL